MFKVYISISLVAILLAATQAQASSIKGHNLPPAQQPESARNVKSLASPERVQRVPAQSPAQAPILESSKRVYNDESIRRSAIAAAEQQQQAVKSPEQPINVVPVVAAPVTPVVVVAQPVAQPAEPTSVVVKDQPAPAAAAPVATPVVPQPAPVVAAPVAPIAAPINEPKVASVEPVVVKAAASEEPLPAASVRSAPIKEEKQPIVVQAAPVAESAVVPVVAQAQVVPAEQPIAKKAESPVAAEVSPVEVKKVELVRPDDQLQAKKYEPAAPVAAVVSQPPQPSQVEPLHIEVPQPDPGLILSEPIDSTTKLLIDLDEHVQKFLPAEDKQEPAQPAKEAVLVQGVDYSPAGQTGAVASPAEPSGKSALPVPYSSVDGEPIVPPLPSLEGVEKASAAGQPSGSSGAAAPGSASQQSSATRQANHGPHQNQQQVITQLLDQLDSLQNRIQDTINQLVARRRYVMSALLRPMGTYVRRVRTNLERLQTRVNSLQAAAQSVGGGSGNGQNRPGGFVDAAAIETIRRRIDDISKRISDIVNRIRFSLTPTSAPMNNNGRK